jgi:DNA-binding GntR family transcriptional regulator
MFMKKISLDELHSDIRREIVDRKFPPGTKISERALCERWHVSRTPIREALRRLESEGFISSSKNKGFVITSISIQDMEQIYTILSSLDSLAGRLATPRVACDPPTLDGLRELIAIMEDSAKMKDIPAYIETNLKFHSLIFRSSGNAWIVRILENLHCHTNRFILNTLYVPRRMEKSLHEHKAILDCLEKGDEKGVEKAIARHFRVSLNDLKTEIGYSLP